MAKGNIQHDVLQLMDKYPVDGIIETMITLGASEGVEKWAAKYFTVPIKPQYIAGDELDKDLIRGVLHEIDLLKQKVARLELDLPKQSPPYNKEALDEVVKVINGWKPVITPEDAQLLRDEVLKGAKLTGAKK
jgi:hypothetical protein